MCPCPMADIFNDNVFVLKVSDVQLEIMYVSFIIATYNYWSMPKSLLHFFLSILPFNFFFLCHSSLVLWMKSTWFYYTILFGQMAYIYRSILECHYKTLIHTHTRASTQTTIHISFERRPWDGPLLGNGIIVAKMWESICCKLDHKILFELCDSDYNTITPCFTQHFFFSCYCICVALSLISDEIGMKLGKTCKLIFVLCAINKEVMCNCFLLFVHVHILKICYVTCMRYTYRATNTIEA